VGPKVQIRECLLSHLQGVRASSKQASMLSPAGVQGQLEARVAVHAGDGAKREGHLEVLSCEHVQVDIDDGTMRSILLMIFLSCLPIAMDGPWDLRGSSLQPHRWRSCQLTQKSTFFFFCPLSANSMLRGTTPGATGRSKSQRGLT
jgi:hypothetical protein